MGSLVQGVWKSGEIETKSTGGKFIRQDSSFKSQIRRGAESKFQPQAGRYHLYVAQACPWAHRTVIFRKLKKLEEVISLSYVAPLMRENGWTFSGDFKDPLYGKSYLYEIYQKAKPDYTGKCTVPVLWDKETETIVNNESSEIIRILNSEFDEFGDPSVNFLPPELIAEIDRVNAFVYDHINNGVYKAGFASDAKAYQEAYAALFAALDEIDNRLSQSQFLVGDQLTEADWRLFTTLARFDAVYYSHFKCNRQHLVSFPHLSKYFWRLYEMPGIAETLDFDQVKEHYFGSHRNINPTGIVPVGPDLNWVLGKTR